MFKATSLRRLNALLLAALTLTGASVLSSGCLLSVGESDLFDDDDQFLPPEPSTHNRCDEDLQICLDSASSSPRQRDLCYRAHKRCLGYPVDPGAGGSPGTGADLPGDSTSTEPLPQDPDWSARCQSVASSCAAFATSGKAKRECAALGQDCHDTDCGAGRLCSTYQVNAQLQGCSDSFRSCNELATDDREIASCATVFRLCGQKIPEIGDMGYDDEVLRCLQTSVLCDRFAAEPELKHTCQTMLSRCLVD